MGLRIGFYGALVTAFAMSSAAKATVQFTDANIYTDAAAVVFPVYPSRSYLSDTTTSSKDLAVATGSIGAAASATINDAAGDSAFDHEDTFATFTSPNSGQVNFTGGGVVAAVSPKALVESFNSGSSFDYDFTLTGKYVLNVGFITGETDSFDPDNYLQVIRTGVLQPPLVAFNPADNAAGSFQLGLGPGSYELGITSTLADTNVVQGPGESIGLHAEQYAFDLTSATPEPGTWALMMLGIGGIGLALRHGGKRRTSDALAA